MKKQKEKTIKKCSCRKKYTLSAWEELKYVGKMKGVDSEVAELRDCSCGSTLMLLISQIKKEGKR